MLKFTQVLLFIALIPSFILAGGADGRQFGSSYTQVTFSPLSSKQYFDSDGELQDNPTYTRNSIDLYGEVGIFSETTSLVWATGVMQHEIEDQSETGMGSTLIGLQHQYMKSNIQLGVGMSVHLPSPVQKDLAFSDSLVHYGISHFLRWKKTSANLHYFGSEHSRALGYDFKYEFHPANKLILTVVVRGQQSLESMEETSFLGYSLQTSYIAPGVEVFYSLNNSFHLVGAFYGGAAMKNIYAAPGIKVGMAMSY